MFLFEFQAVLFSLAILGACSLTDSTSSSRTTGHYHARVSNADDNQIIQRTMLATAQRHRWHHFTILRSRMRLSPRRPRNRLLFLQEPKNVQQQHAMVLEILPLGRTRV